MRYQMKLLAHNGVYGANPVEPFAGDIMGFAGSGINPANREAVAEAKITVPVGREFTYSHTEVSGDLTAYCFREKVVTEPSDWAKEHGRA